MESQLIRVLGECVGNHLKEKINLIDQEKKVYVISREIVHLYKLHQLVVQYLNH